MRLLRISLGRSVAECAIVWMAITLGAFAQAISTTTVQGTVYLANGSAGSGTLQVSWPAFTTAANQAVAAGKMTTEIGADGFVSVNLAPNLGSSPAGLYYTAIYHLSDGTTSTEYWVVPAAAQATIAQVRSQVLPAAQAVQAVSKAYVDQAVQSVAQGNLTSTGGQLTGPLYLTGDPTQALQAADKHYVDTTFAQALPLAGGTATGPLTAKQLGAAYQVDQFQGADFGAKLQACVSVLSSGYGGTCDARNFSGDLGMTSDVTIGTANATVLLPCATITTAKQFIITAGTRNVSLRGCSLRGASNASGSKGGTVLLYSGADAAVRVGDQTYSADTLGFHLDNVLINVTASSSASTRAIAANRTQEIDLESLYLLGNANQTGLVLDGTGNYTGGTFYDNHISGFQTAIMGIGHQISNSAATDWLNASTFVRLHINCPTENGNPISGTYGINLQQGDGNSFTGGDVEGCATALHLGANAQNNTIVGLRNENSSYQVVADAGSSYNSWMTGGTMYTGKLSDSGTRNSFLDTFHRSFNSLNGDWYGSQQDATVTNHFRLGIGNGNERGILDRYQTDYGYRWTLGLSDATEGEQYYQLLDELNSVYRISVGQYNKDQASTNNQTVINAAGTGAVVLNGSNNAGTGGVVFGSGGPNETTVATVSNSGNAQFNGTLQVGGTTQSAGTMTVRNNADAEVDYYLWPGLTTSQKGSFTYKDYNGNSQWFLVKDASNNWALNSALGGLDSFKAYQSTNSGDTYINASNASGVVRVNYETGSGTAFNIYGGGSSNLYASFSGTNAIKFPGISAGSGRNCLQIDSSGYISNTGAACGTGSGNGTVNSGVAGQLAYYNGNGTAVSGLSTVPVSAGGTGSTDAPGGLAALGGASVVSAAQQNFAGRINASVNSQLNVISFGAKGDCVTDDTSAFDAAQTAAIGMAVGNATPGVLYLPKPPGGCYIVSNWTWKGVSIEGQPAGLGPASPKTYPVTLKSKPGTDILHVADPTTVSGQSRIYPGWSIRNVGFIVDNSTPGTFPHRWPGRWFDDAGTTAGSNVFTTGNARVTCGDIGEPILVGGAGGTATTDTLGAAITSTNQKTLSLRNGISASWPSIFAYLKVDSEIMLVELQGLANGTVTFTNVQRGQAGTAAATHSSGAAVTVLANLSTTIGNVTPCWQSPTTLGWTVITLAASASATMTNAHAYISVLGLPVTQTLGNAAIAQDLQDGLSSDWTGTLLTGNYGKMENVSFTTTNGTSGSSPNGYTSAIFTQGTPWLYGIDVHDIFVNGFYFGIAQTGSELNSFQQSSSGDYEKWDHGMFFFNVSPWLSYNGLNQRLVDLQVTGYAGPQILQLANVAYDSASGWYVSNMGFETPNNQMSWGWRVTGAFHTFDGVSLTSHANGQIATWDAVGSKCVCDAVNTSVNGYANEFKTGSQPTGVLESGLNNKVIWTYNGNTYNGLPSTRDITSIPYKGNNSIAGRFTGDFAFDGNTVPYSKDDLIIWPQDLEFGYTQGWGTFVQQDSTSPSGYYAVMAPGASTTQFGKFNSYVQLGNTGNSIVLGTNLPATGADLYAAVKCPSGTSSFYLRLSAYGGSSFQTQFTNCTTSYQVYRVSGKWAGSDAGKAVFVSNGAGVTNSTSYVAYWIIVPWKGLYNGFVPQPADGSIVFNPINSMLGVNSKLAADAASPYGTSFGEVGADYIRSFNGDSNSNGGHWLPAVPSRVTYWIGAPSVFTDTLGAAVLGTDTTLTLGTATTSTWGSSGYLQVDQEIVKYTGVSAGLTSITVVRGQYGTMAQAHSSGTAVSSVGIGQLGIKCGGSFVSNINVYYAPSYQTFSAPFPAQQCSGQAMAIGYLGYQNGPGGQTYNLVQVQVKPDEAQLATPSAANQVPVSAGLGSGNPMYAFNSTIPLAGSGTALTTGPASGTTANHVVTFAGSNGQIQDGGAGMPLAGTTGSIGGSALATGQCATGTMAIAGATTSMAVAVSPSAGAGPGAGFVWQGYVSAPGSVTVQVCAVAAGTPTPATYNVRVIQ